MLSKKNCEQKFVKYFLKSSVLYYSFVILFVVIFLFGSITLRVDIHNAFPAYIEGNKITVKSNSKILILGNQVYLYENRNEKVVPVSVTREDYINGETYFYIKENVVNISSKVTLEAKVGEQSLFEKIFVKAGKN